MTKSIKEKFPDVEVILWTAYGNIEDGVQAIKNGAFDYIMKGDDNNKIIPLLYRAFEKIDLAPNTAWHLEANRETWLLVISGSARTGSFDVAMGDAVFAQSDRLNIRSGVLGLSVLVAYTGELIPELLQHADMETAQ